MGRRKPDTTSAVVDINTLEIKPPKAKEPSPLSIVVEQSFEPIIKAVTEKGYSLTDICQMLRKRGIRPAPKTLKLAMIAYAEKNGRFHELPTVFHLTPRPKNGEENQLDNSAETDNTDDTEVEEGSIEQLVVEEGSNKDAPAKEYVEMPENL